MDAVREDTEAVGVTGEDVEDRWKGSGEIGHLANWLKEEEEEYFNHFHSSLCPNLTSISSMNRLI